jgi:hypothetical protein
MKQFLAILIVGTAALTNVFAQCCSPGSPVAGSANIGILNEGSWRVIGFYRHSYSNQYLQGNKSTDYSFVQASGFDFSGISLGYGLTEKLTIETEVGYFFRKYQDLQLANVHRLSGAGLSSGVLSLKKNFYKKMEREWEVTAGAGFKYPFNSSQQQVDGVVLPQDIQPSSGAFGFVGQLFISKGYVCNGTRIFLINRTEVNGVNASAYQYGILSQTSVFYLKNINDKLAGLMQARHELKTKDKRNDQVINYSGGHQVFLSPQLSYIPLKGISISATFDYPVFQFLNGIQMGNRYAVSAILIKDF